MRPQIIKAFTDDPWKDVEMPEGFNPDGNKFLNPEKFRREAARRRAQAVEAGLEDTVEVIEAIKKWKTFEDGLPVSSVGDGKIPSFAVYDCSLWGLLLKAAGYHEETKEVIQKLRSLPLYRENGLVNLASTKEKCENTKIESLSNVLWGLLLNAAGYKEDAVNVIEGMRAVPNLVYSNNLVRDYSDENDPEAGRIVFSMYCSLWGLLLNAAGYNESGLNAGKVIESIKSTQLYRPDGLVSDSATEEGNARESDVTVYYNAYWGLLLHAAGYKADAGKVAESMEKLGLERNGLLLMDNCGSSKINSGANSMWGLYLRAIGNEQGADDIVAAIKASPVLYQNGLVRGHMKEDGSPGARSSVNLLNCCQFGLVQAKESYKLFTGEK